MSKTREELIQEEIEKRVFEEEAKKQKNADEALTYDALDEASELNREEVEQVAETVKMEFAEREAASSHVKRNLAIAAAIFALFFGLLTMSKYNAMVRLDEQVKTQWSQVENVYQRRLDLIPNLVRAAQAHAQHEEAIFKMLTDARAKAGGTLSADALSNSAKFQEFQQAQRELSNALGRMMAVVESNPDIKSDQAFLALQAQLEGSENRIAVERKRLNEAVQGYNSYIRRFPQSAVAGAFGFGEKAYFKADPGAENAPEVTFQ